MSQPPRPIDGALGIVLILVAGLPISPLAAQPPKQVTFQRDIRPILSDNCFQCHGPDQAKRKADLRLDTEEGATADARILAPDKPGRSELLRRITAADDKVRMPPAKTGRRLSAQQVELIRRWIEQGARWEKHWSLIPPRRPDLPPVHNAAWVRSPVDRFILARLEKEELAPSPPAERSALLRRVTLDLTGLPPTPGEVDAFLADASPNAYVKVVDRLLASPRFGERMAMRWLDGARYADTNGYQSDGERTMWRWRDWVIDAYNANVPFDRFTVEQLAGDMLPHATLEQKIATGFNRNHRGNGEGGIIPEEYAVEYVVDRVETTATVWLGLTMGCGRCHDHKYDPITQKEFYQAFAYFNNVPERGKAVKYGNSPPFIKAPTADQRRQLAETESVLRELEDKFAKLQPEIASAQAAWEASLGARPLSWSPGRGLVAHFPLDASLTNAAGKGGQGRSRDGDPDYVAGKFGQAVAFDGRPALELGDVGDFGFYDKFTLSAWVYPDPSKGGIILSRMADSAYSEGYSLALEQGKLHVNLVKRWLDDALRVETRDAISPGQWHHLLATYDGSRVARGIQVFVDGRRRPLTISLDDLNQDFRAKEAFRIGSGSGAEDRFHGRIDEVRVYDEVLPPAEIAALATPETIAEIAAIPPAKRAEGQTQKISLCFLEEHAPDTVRLSYQLMQSFRREREALAESIPTTMVMEEMPVPRETHLLLRGAYDRPGPKVSPGIPASLGTTPPDQPNNRLGFARWLVRPSNPLTARVTVNRLWQMLFGTGLVKTVDDFGAQGESPSHPELLDWLAVEFVRTGWDVKAILKSIVTSNTYRQSSRVTPDLLRKDPDNRLLARGPRQRLSAEMIRDQALALSGLLVERLGGPSVKPYQPSGLWKELTGADEYQQDHGDKLYRRGLYTFWKRTVAPPQMVTFDAAGRETCVVREVRTNTPLQALNLMNDVTFVEAARVLAERLLREGGRSPEDRLTLAFRLATARRPKPVELRILVQDLENQRCRFRDNPRAVSELLRVGERRADLAFDAGELAAYAAVAGLILNLDEAITKE